MADDRRRVLLVQLPIPPPGPGPIRGNVPLAAAYMKMTARRRGLEAAYAIDILPTEQANSLGDQALAAAILAREPWLVGFTCYLWNIERTLWLAQRLKQQRPDIFIVLGGPEITADNAWVLDCDAVDFAAIGEGEQTFCELLAELSRGRRPGRPVDGLYVRDVEGSSPRGALPMLSPRPLPAFRQPLRDLDEISSPYLEGILDAADEQMLLLETIRGCVFKCKFCYYPKSYDSLYFLSRERLIANLRHARQRGAREVVLLDPTLNQRKDFAGFLRILADENPDGQFEYFGELRAEGIDGNLARLLREANFTEVEIGLQSIDPAAQELMDRKNNMRAFDRGVSALLDAGINVKIDLIIGLPGDTAESIRRGLRYLRESGLYSSVQVFNLSVLPGTAFRQEAASLGLNFQPRPPYYVTETPTLGLAEMLGLMEEAQQEFGVEFDPLPAPVLEFPESSDVVHCVRWNLDDERLRPAIPASRLAQATTLWLRSGDFSRRRDEAAGLAADVLAANPFSTLQVVLEPTSNAGSISPQFVELLVQACYAHASYLDKFYAVLPGRPKGAKRLIILLPLGQRTALDRRWLDRLGELATIVWRGARESANALEEHEYVVA